jgi:endoglucanase
MAIPSLLRDLLTSPGPSGYEHAPASIFRKAAESFAEVSANKIGSSLASVKGKNPDPCLAIMGHMDEIGLIVTHIDDEGYLWVTNVGGWDPAVLIGQRISLMTKEGTVSGVVGKKAIHLLTPEERKKPAELKNLHIDIGAKDRDEARKLVRIGDVAVIDTQPLELRNGVITSRSLDNRIGCFVAYETARLVSKAGGAEGEVVAVATSQEEIGGMGAATTTFGLDPDLAIVIDVTHATDVPGTNEKELGSHHLGSGPVISRGSTLHPKIFELLYETAEAEGIPFTVNAYGARTRTDADSVHTVRGGIPTGLVKVPLRYMHSPVEVMQLEDIHNTAKLLAAFALALPSDISFLR